MSTLHLTPAEIAMFEKLPAALREGWTVEEETLLFHDADNRLRMRMDMMRVKNPALLAFKEMAQKAQSPDEIYAAAQTVDLSSLNEDDLGEMLFAVGPDGLTLMIHQALTIGISADEEIAQFASLTEVRHGLLKSFQSITA